MTYSQSISPNPVWFVPIWDWQWENYQNAFYLRGIDTVNGGYAVIDAFENMFSDFSKFWGKLTLISYKEDGTSYATFGTFFFNSVFTTVINTIATLFTTILAAFAFAKIQFKGKNRLFALLLSTMMVPGEMLLITNLITINQLGWMDNYLALIVPFTASIFYIYLLRQFFLQVPDSLYKAARVDGCGDWKFLWKVMVPMSTNTLVTIAILNAIASWNAYLWPLIILQTDKQKTVTLMISSMSSAYFPEYGVIMTAIVIATLPIIIVFFGFQKYFVQGMLGSSLKQ